MTHSLETLELHHHVNGRGADRARHGPSVLRESASLGAGAHSADESNVPPGRAGGPIAPAPIDSVPPGVSNSLRPRRSPAREAARAARSGLAEVGVRYTPKSGRLQGW